MSEDYCVPASEARTELRVLNSRFIATGAPVFSVDEAKAFVGRVKEEFADASHNVPAYLVGHGAAITAHCSDDGEPSGTAGRPALAVLQGSDLGDVAVVVTRYFGGTKLGTGGLVRAYSDAVRQLLTELPLARKVTATTLMVQVAYPLFERVRRLIGAHHGQVLEEEFAAKVTILALFAQTNIQPFESELQELSSGTIQAEIVTADETILVPIGSEKCAHQCEG
jgi:uncharacterized YigZ family protein